MTTILVKHKGTQYVTKVLVATNEDGSKRYIVCKPTLVWPVGK